MNLLNIPESQSSTQQNTEQATRSQTQRYQLRRNRAPRYRCGTCGSRDCSCVNLVMSETPDHRLARGVNDPACEPLTTRAPGHSHPRYAILAIQWRRNTFLP